jgi:two-component system response regulator YesN
MLLKVLLVDDDILARNHLRSIISWEKHSMTICGEAADGKTAIHMMEELQPDILILDVNMPHMNGVELSEYISKTYKQMKMIMLSSYDTYEYVRSTLKNGAVDYLLKHQMNSETLLKVVQKLIEQLESDTNIRLQQEDTNRKWEMAGPIVTQNYLKDLILRKINESSLNLTNFRTMVFGAEKPNWYLVTMQIVNFELITARFTDTEMNAYHRSIIDLCQQAIGDYKDGCSAYMERGRFVLLLSLEESRSENVMQQQLETLIRRLEMTLKNFFNVTAVFVYNSPFHRLGQLPDKYESLVQRLDEMMGKGNYKDAAGSLEGLEVSISIKEEKQLLSIVDQSDKAELRELLNGIFKRMVHADYYTSQRVLAELIHIAGKIGTKAGLDMNWMNHDLARFSGQGDQFELSKKLILQVYEKIADELQIKRKVYYSSYVNQAIQRVQASYHSGISLEGVAEEIGITSSYLSRLFKEETGKTFTEYLNEYRIEISKRLIEDSDLKIKEIYQRIGFNSYSYFIKMFKEIVGETPFSFAGKSIRAKK